MLTWRDDRIYHTHHVDQRQPSARDHDRIIYTSAFMRLSGVTQVVSPTEGFICHNRLIHSLKVAQLGRRLAEKLVTEQRELASAIGGVNPEAVAAAALAHDLGHPPFGHIAETTLSDLLAEHGDFDGYEGNAQSFRIVTKLAMHGSNYRGLNLTRATLSALLKYPWLREAEGKRHHKWGAYPSEKEEFTWARQGFSDDNKSAEAEIMDWADDVTYSAHDAEDFFRAGLIPLHLLSRDEYERDAFITGAFERLTAVGSLHTYTYENLRQTFVNLIETFPLTDPYHAKRDDRWQLRTYTSRLIDKYVHAIKLTSPPTNDGKRVMIDRLSHMEVTMLKELTWYYVINSPALHTQQFAQKKMIRDLFEIFCTEAKRGNWSMFPQGSQEEFRLSESSGYNRIIADIIASMTEDQTRRMYHRLSGITVGSVLDHI